MLLIQIFSHFLAISSDIATRIASALLLLLLLYPSYYRYLALIAEKAIVRSAQRSDRRAIRR
jgi:hypothetical protein